MPTLAFNPFDTTPFTPRWQCGHWEPWLGWLTIISDSLIFIAYAAIPAALAVVLIRRRDFPFPLVLSLFVMFILSCGLTHLVEVFIFYKPLYGLNALIKAVTAIVSLITAGLLIYSLPVALTLPSIQRTNTRLLEALEREQTLSTELAQTRDELETRSAAMTFKMRRLIDALTATGVIACRWEPNTGQIDWEIGFAPSAHAAGLGLDKMFDNWSSLLTPESAAQLSRRAIEVCNSSTRLDFSADVAGSTLKVRLAAHPDPPVADQPRLLTGMFRFITEDEYKKAQAS